jgi:hypothetical protein
MRSCRSLLACLVAALTLQVVASQDDGQRAAQLAQRVAGTLPNAAAFQGSTTQQAGPEAATSRLPSVAAVSCAAPHVPAEFFPARVLGGAPSYACSLAGQPWSGWRCACLCTHTGGAACLKGAARGRRPRAAQTRQRRPASCASGCPGAAATATCSCPAAIRPLRPARSSSPSTAPARAVWTAWACLSTRQTRRVRCALVRLLRSDAKFVIWCAVKGAGAHTSCAGCAAQELCCHLPWVGRGSRVCLSCTAVGKASG